MPQPLAEGGRHFSPVIRFTDARDYGLGNGFHQSLAVLLVGPNPGMKHRGARPGHPVAIGLNLMVLFWKWGGCRETAGYFRWFVAGSAENRRSGEHVAYKAYTNLR
jgi:hypothetical protein